MSNITAPSDAETVSFSPLVIDSESAEPHRDRQALADVIEAGRISGAVETPLPDEEFRPDPSQEEALKRLDPIVRENLDETRMPDEQVFDGQHEMAADDFNEKVETEIGRRDRIAGVFDRGQQHMEEETGDYFSTVFDPNLPVTPALADAVKTSPDGPRLMYALANDPTRLDEANQLAQAGNVNSALNLVRKDLGLATRRSSTNAPAPVPTLSGRGALTPSSPSRMSYSEYKAGRLSGKIK